MDKWVFGVGIDRLLAVLDGLRPKMIVATDDQTNIDAQFRPAFAAGTRRLYVDIARRCLHVFPHPGFTG